MNDHLHATVRTNLVQVSHGFREDLGGIHSREGY